MSNKEENDVRSLYENPWIKKSPIFERHYNSMNPWFYWVFKKSYFFSFPYITPEGEQKGEQILHRKKVIKSTFDNLK